MDAMQIAMAEGSCHVHMCPAADWVSMVVVCAVYLLVPFHAFLVLMGFFWWGIAVPLTGVDVGCRQAAYVGPAYGLLSYPVHHLLILSLLSSYDLC